MRPSLRRAAASARRGRRLLSTQSVSEIALDGPSGATPDGNVLVVDKWEFESPKTKQAVAALAAIGAEGKVLVVFGDDDANAWKSFRNLTDVHCLHAGELNTYDVLNADVVVFTEATLPTGESVSDAPAADGDRTEEE